MTLTTGICQQIFEALISCLYKVMERTAITSLANQLTNSLEATLSVWATSMSSPIHSVVRKKVSERVWLATSENKPITHLKVMVSSWSMRGWPHSCKQKCLHLMLTGCMSEMRNCTPTFKFPYTLGNYMWISSSDPTHTMEHITVKEIGCLTTLLLLGCRQSKETVVMRGLLWY